MQTITKSMSIKGIVAELNKRIIAYLVLPKSDREKLSKDDLLEMLGKPPLPEIILIELLEFTTAEKLQKDLLNIVTNDPKVFIGK